MQQQFVGLTMPVFIAFGWEGEEAALNFALSQLEQFIEALHAAMPRRLQNHLPAFGMTPSEHLVYLAANQDPDKDLFITFVTRTTSLELQVGITDQMAIGRALKALTGDPERGLQILKDLGTAWNLHIKQMEVDEDSGERTSYQDLYKGEINDLDVEKLTEVVERAAFLNGEPQWATPIYISRRYGSEPIATMGTQVVPYMVEQLKEMIPLIEFLTGKEGRATAKKAKKQVVKAEATRPEDIDPDSQFVYVTQMQPLHIRRGFINLTPQHWDFFARTARSTTRDIRVRFEDKVDEASSVWRLASNDMVRIVVGDAVRVWLEETFEPEDNVQVLATKLDDDEIEIVLKPVA